MTMDGILMVVLINISIRISTIFFQIETVTCTTASGTETLHRDTSKDFKAEPCGMTPGCQTVPTTITRHQETKIGSDHQITIVATLHREDLEVRMLIMAKDDMRMEIKDTILQIHQTGNTMREADQIVLVDNRL